jgi:hypothetical protein
MARPPREVPRVRLEAAHAYHALAGDLPRFLAAIPYWLGWKGVPR